MILGSAAAALHAREELEAAEQQELDWWKPAEFHYPRCTFESQITLLQAGVFFDPKGEALLLDDLLMKHRVKPKDAIHLMIAHSAKLDRVLTWDTKLVSKASKVNWLIPQTETPTSFLASWRN